MIKNKTKKSMTTTGKLGVLGLAAIVVSSMVGGGIFSLPQNMAQSASVGAVILAWIITGIGMFFREFAEAVLQRFEYDIGNNFMRDKPENYTEEELTFYWSEKDYREFLEELKEYQP